MTRFEVGLVAALVVIWIPGFLVLSRVWSDVDYASHGFLIPFVALWAATAHRARLSKINSAPQPGGLLWIAAALVAYLAALTMGDATLLGLCLVSTVTLVLIALRGIEWASTLRFSLAYLLFLVPLPPDWVTPVIVRLQLSMSSAAVRILQELGVAIYRDGNVLMLPGDRNLFVAEACSGITSLITLIPIGVFIAYFTEARLNRQLALVATVLPIALAGNLLRVLLTVAISLRVDVKTATEGPLHEWAGVGTYVLGCLCLLGVGALMKHFWPENDGPLES